MHMKELEEVREAAGLLTFVIPAQPPYGIGASAPFAISADVPEKFTPLGSGFRRNDARDAIFVVCLIPQTKN